MNEKVVEVMEADSTTLETDSKELEDPKGSPFFFIKLPRNVSWYETNVVGPMQRGGAVGLITNLQNAGILAPEMPCLPPCTAKTQCRKARVLDGMHWHCATCNKNRSVRENSIFKNSYCKLLECMIILAGWSEDVDENFIAEEIGIKPRLVSSLYEKLDILAAAEHCMTRLGGTQSAVLIDLYPSTPPHTILMLSDTKNVPPRYWLNALSLPQPKVENNNNSKKWKVNIEAAILSAVLSVVRSVVDPGGDCVIGDAASKVEGIRETLKDAQRFTDIRMMNDLEATCPSDLLIFLREGIWRQARLVSAAASGGCNAGRQRYLNAALYRLSYDADGFLPILMRLVARRRAANC